MRSTGFIKCIRRLVLTLMILTLVFAIAVNVLFNMKDFWLMPTPVSSAFENVKTLLRGSKDDTMKKLANRNSLAAANRSLVDVFEGFRNKNKQINVTQKRKILTRNDTLLVLWYNKPVWININFANHILSSSVCTYENCRMSADKTNLARYAAIIFSFTHKLDFSPPITRAERSRDQAWIFFGLESPIYHDKIAYRHKNWMNTMNWSMSYRRDADIFFPYGMLERRKEQTKRNYSEIFLRKTKQAAWLVSNCGAASYRDVFVSELQKYGLEVDIFGVCNDSVFHDRGNIMSLINKDYKFFLSFENSLCKDYVTEKFFRYYNLDLILVVRGGADYDHALPNNTFINSAHFESPKTLATFLLKVISSEKIYTSILRQKDRYIASEMFTMPTSYCSICEKLNNLNENRKTYMDHVTYIHEDRCWIASDIPFRISQFKDSILTSLFLFVIVICCVALRRECCSTSKRKRTLNR